ncbi:undecaprenyldiphospho-muramoylpentapeptide beta-N-acetylglucosaminyltransferase [Nosocomiicoccus massiliensis]|uniref:undecaprenyldiphospho-muramoylpentapeptide beta-N-acetylglucosaminyltransferase n=1 Tax=Nosocomiicoccus massiliensis TaxID=1232430 RepID=UPI000406DE7F|nr:undecaprenyldiphospho-muramoylpentapeptide beta-N-acetylglucosaminyltransferase [Nosocomiicoccus massiliensis]
MKLKDDVVVLTGGGTIGHVMLNTLIAPELLNENVKPYYIGSKTGIEKEIIEKSGIEYYSISSGKLRRYLSFENIKDVFKVTKGIFDARRILKKLKPKFVFSKGGFVSVPVVLAAKSLKIPVYIHESDISPGLANKIAGKFAKKIFVTFEKTLNYVDSSKSEYVGPVIREELLHGSKEIAKNITGLDPNKPTIMFIGGSLGAKSINDLVHNHIDTFVDQYQVIHITGPDNMREDIKHPNYRQYEFVQHELAHFYKMSDVVISRSGANVIYELLLLKQPMLLIPLPLSQSRGDQIENAEYFKSKGYAETIEDESITPKRIIDNIRKIENNKLEYIKNMETFTAGMTPKRLTEHLLKEE